MADSGGLVEPARCSAAGHADSHATGGHGQGVPAYLLKCGSCNINASLSATKERMPLSSETENRSAPHSAHLGNGGENVSRASCLESDAHNANVALGHWTPLPSRYPDSRDLRQDGEAARLRARERLEVRLLLICPWLDFTLLQDPPRAAVLDPRGDARCLPCLVIPFLPSS